MVGESVCDAAAQKAHYEEVVDLPQPLSLGAASPLADNTRSMGSTSRSMGETPKAETAVDSSAHAEVETGIQAPPVPPRSRDRSSSET